MKRLFVVILAVLIASLGATTVYSQAPSTCPDWMAFAHICVSDDGLTEENLPPTSDYVNTYTLDGRWLSCFDVLEQMPWLSEKFSANYPNGYIVSVQSLAFDTRIVNDPPQDTGDFFDGYYLTLAVNPADGVYDSVVCVSYPAQYIELPDGPYARIPRSGFIDIEWK